MFTGLVSFCTLLYTLFTLTNVQDTQCNLRSDYSCYLRSSVVLAKNQNLWQQTSRQRPCKLGQAYLTALLITLSADVASNPGPSTNFPCGTCLQPVTWEQDGVLCDDCETWFHTTCQNIGQASYQALADHPSCSWVLHKVRISKL